MKRKRKQNIIPNKILVVILGLMMSLGSFPMTRAVFAVPTGIQIDQNNFPDEVFRNYVKNDFDQNSDNVLDENECNSVKKIHIPLTVNKKEMVENLKGIEYFPNLETIICREHRITDIDISKNPELSELNLNRNMLSSIDISRNPKLTSLYLTENQLKTIDVSNNPELTKLGLAGNQLETINTSKNSKLISLYLLENQLKTIDISKNPELTNLNLNSNQLNAIDISKNPKLGFISLAGNQLEAIDVSSNPELRTLDLTYNKLKAIDVSKNSKLVKLFLNANQLKTIDVSKNPALNILDAWENQLEAIDLSRNPELTSIDLSDNQLETINISNIDKLKKLLLKNNGLTSLDISNGEYDSDIFPTGNSGGGKYKHDCEQNYSINVYVDAKTPDELQFDLKSLPKGFDVSKTRKWEGAKVEGTTLKIDSNKPSKIKYEYIAAEKNGTRPEGYLSVNLNVHYVDVPGISTVSFDGNGGKPEQSSLKTDNHGKLVDLPSVTYEGYIFDGWYTEKEAGDKVDTNMVFKADTVLYAHWKEDKAYQDKLKDLKASSVKEVEKAAAKRNGEIDAVKNADADEVKNAKAKVEKEKTDGINAVEKAKTVKAVSEAKDAAIAAIGKVKLPKEGTPTGIQIDQNNFPDEVFRDYVKNNFDTDRNNVLDENECYYVKRIIDNKPKKEEKKFKNLKGIEYFTNLEKIDLSYHKITHVDLSKNLKVENVNFFYNQMETIDVSKNSKLIELNVSYNKLKTIDVSKNSKLYSFEARDNQLKTIDVSKNPNLRDLEIHGNKLETIDVSKNPDLERLVVSRNKLKTIDVSENPALDRLEAWDNQLETIDLSGNPELVSLNLNANQLKAIDLSKNLKLTKLSLNDNQLKAIDVSNNPELAGIYLSDNQLETINISNIDKLKKLLLKNNGLTSLNISNGKYDSDIFPTGNSGGGKYKHDCEQNYSINVYVDAKKPGELQFDLQSLPKGFDVSKTRKWEGAKVEGTTLKIDSNKPSKIKYEYIVAEKNGTRPEGYLSVNLNVNYVDVPGISTVSFDGNGGKPERSSLKTDNHGKLVDLPSVTYEGYIFDGWYTEKEAGDKVDTNMVFKADTVLYAHWKEDKAYQDKLKDLKASSIKEVEKAAAKRNGEIDAVKGADADEVKNAKAKVEKEKTDGINAVENAKTVKAVGEAKDAAIEAIGKVELPKAGGVTPPAPTGEYTITFNPGGGKAAKETAKTDKDGKLKDMPSATYEGYIFEGWYTKKDAGDKVDTNTVFKADTVIYAHWKEDKAYQDELKDLKAASVKEVEKAAAEKTAELEKTPNVKAEEIDKAKAQVEAEKAAGIKKINEGKTKSEVTESKDKAIEAIKAVKVETLNTLNAAKDEAKKAINEAAAKRKVEIDAVKNADADEVKAAKAKVEKEKTDGINAVENAKTVKAVGEAKDAAIEAIGKVELPKAGLSPEEKLANAKKDAKAKIEEAATKKNKEIDKASATPEAKQEAKDKVAKAKEAADKAVENADTIAKVDEARDNGITEIGKVEVKTTTPTGKEYEVKFISNKIGATKEEVVETRKIKEGEKVGDLPKALTDENRPDYRFSGWYTKKEGGDKLEAATKIEKEMTIYAHWKKRAIAKNYADVSGNKFSIKGTKNLNVNEGVYQDEKLPKNTRPYQLTVTAKPNRRMLVEWTNCKKLGADIDGYIITRKVGRSDTFVHYATVGANRNYFIDTLPKKNTNYYYMVFGYKKDKMGNITISENSMSAVGQRLDSAKINPYAPKLNYTKKTIRQGESVKLRLTYPKNSISTWTRWRTHNDAVKVAKVNQQGVVTGLNKGTVLVSARTPNGRDIRCLITVI